VFVRVCIHVCQYSLAHLARSGVARRSGDRGVGFIRMHELATIKYAVAVAEFLVGITHGVSHPANSNSLHHTYFDVGMYNNKLTSVRTGYSTNANNIHTYFAYAFIYKNSLLRVNYYPFFSRSPYRHIAAELALFLYQNCSLV
jgi:hypothetical protein